MAISKLLYIILLIVSILFFILYSAQFSLYLLIFTVSLPFIMKFCVVLAKFLVSADIESQSETTVKNGRTTLSLTVTNKTPLPFPNSIATIEYKNSLMNVTDTMTIQIPVHPLCSEKITFSLTSDFCGILNVRVKSVQIFDFIKLFSCSVKPKKICSITVLPEIVPVKSADSFSMINSEESDIFSKNKSGDDPSEIFALKNYAPGDKPNRIHWNLSLKQDDIIVRHYSLPISSSILVVLDFCGTPSVKNIKTLDTAAQTAFSIALFLSQNDIPFKFAYFTTENAVLPVSDDTDVTAAMKDIFLSGPAEKTSPNLCLHDISQQYSGIFYVTSSEDNLSEILRDNGSGNIKPFFIQNEQCSPCFDPDNEITIIPAEKGLSDIII